MDHHHRCATQPVARASARLVGGGELELFFFLNDFFPFRDILLVRQRYIITMNVRDKYKYESIITIKWTNNVAAITIDLNEL